MGKAQGCVLITDRNPNVRELLHRELLLRGFSPVQVRDGRELCARLASSDLLDVVVLDPEIDPAPCLSSKEGIATWTTRVPFVLHVFPSSELNETLASHAAAVVEKGGDTSSLLSVIGMLAKGPTTPKGHKDSS
jgi:DNA-binding response OmpR family regulator